MERFLDILALILSAAGFLFSVMLFVIDILFYPKNND